MSARRFSTGQRFYLQGRLYEVKRLLAAEAKVSVEELATGDTLLLSLHTLVAALFQGDLAFQPEGRTGTQVKPPVQELSDYPAHLVDIARWRLSVIQPLLDTDRAGRTKAVVTQRVADVKAKIAAQPHQAGLESSVSLRSVYRWIRDYERGQADLRVLIPSTRQRGGRGKARLNPTVNAVLEAVVRDNYYRPERVTVKQLAALTAARLQDENRLLPAIEQLAAPSEATITRRLTTLDGQQVLRAKKGKRAAAAAYTQASLMTPARLPLERVEIDHTRTDVIVIDEADCLPLGRPTLTYCIDGATRYPLGYYLGFEPPSYHAVMECLYHAICPKENVREKYQAEHDWIAYGIPSILITDNGKEFIGKDLPDACAALGVVLEQCPVKTPELKPGVERMIGTLNSGLFHTLPGTTFANVTQRGEYDSVGAACISLGELEAALNVFIVDIYAESYHRQMGAIPARRWQAALAESFSPRLPASRQELLVLLGRVEYRTINRDGIFFEGLRYNSGQLGSLRARLDGAKAKLKYHPGDLSRLHVFDPDNGYLEVPALDQTYTARLSLWKHRIIRRWARLQEDEVDMAALGRALEKIQGIVDAARTRKRALRRAGTNATLARLEGAGVPSSLMGQKAPAPLPGRDLSIAPIDEALPGEAGFDYDYLRPVQPKAHQGSRDQQHPSAAERA